MVVYVEVVIIDNFVITALLSVISFKILNRKIKKLRIFFCSLVGTAAAVVFPLLKLSAYILTALKLLVAVALSLILFFKNGKVLAGGLVFTLCTFALGGIMFALGFLKYADVVKALTMPLFNFPIGLVLAGAAIFIAMAGVLFRHLKSRLKSAQYTFKVRLGLFNKKMKLRGYLDTGNILTDSKSGLPVAVVGIKSLIHTLDDETLKLILTGKGDELENAHYERISSVGRADGRLLIVKPDSLELFFKDKAHIINDVALGISVGRVKIYDCELILQTAIIDKLSA